MNAGSFDRPFYLRRTMTETGLNGTTTTAGEVDVRVVWCRFESTVASEVVATNRVGAVDRITVLARYDPDVCLDAVLRDTNNQRYRVQSVFERDAREVLQVVLLLLNGESPQG